VPNLSQLQKSSVLSRTLWVVAALFILTAGAELTLRLLLGLGNPVLVAPDPACAYVLRPNQNVYRFFCHTRTDQYGMRSDPFPAVPQPGTLRILFVGDSVTYGTSHVDQSNIFSEIIRRDLPSIVHRPVEVLNASAGGWAPDNELSWVRSRGIFHSDVVLLVLNSGDLGQPRANASDLGEDTPSRRPPTAISELWTRYLRHKLFHVAAKTDAGDAAVPNAEATIQSNLADLETFDNLVTSQHARFAIVYIPFRHEIPDPAAESEVTLHGWAERHHVPLFDLTSAEASWPTAQISIDGDHLNENGNRIVAAAIESGWCSNLGL
jgi:lysophospholipase L1-like esterase